MMKQKSGKYAKRAVLPIADMETANEPITNALDATGRFSTEQCNQLSDGILQYIDDYGLILIKKIGNCT
jgi:hypothetical protein